LSIREDLAYLGSLGPYMAASVLLFFGSAVLAYSAASQDPQFAATWLKEMEMLKWIMGLEPWQILLVIFFKNMLACAVSILLGIAFGLVPLLVATSNGILIGVVSYQVLTQKSVGYLLAGVVPHGIIELPVVLLCIAIGFRLGYRFFNALMGRREDLREEVRLALHFLIWRAAPLLFLAAMIETFITPLAISVMV